MASAPTFTLPPPTAKKTKLNAWQTWIAKHPGWKTYAPLIETWAESAKIDKLGLAIALSRKYGPAPKNLNDRSFNQDSATLASYVNAMGWDAGYRAWSNNPNVTITQLAPKGYTFKGLETPAAAASSSAANAQARIPTTNPYVYIGPDGTLRKWGGTTPPTQEQLAALQGQQPSGKPISRRGGGPGGTTMKPLPKGALPITYFGQPLTLSDYGQLKQHLDGIYLAYTGRRATPAEVQRILANGTTDFQLQQNLSKLPSFQRSPIWKQTAPSYTAVAQNIYGPNWKASDPETKKLLANAIVNNIGGEAFANQLRHLPGYVNTQEFKQSAAQFSTVYKNIYGSNDPNEGVIVREATLAGWSPEQFTTYLRSLPQYTASGEYLYKATALSDALGLITGQQTTLQPGQLPPNPAAPGRLPNSASIPGNPNLSPPQTAGLTVG